MFERGKHNRANSPWEPLLGDQLPLGWMVGVFEDVDMVGIYMVCIVYSIYVYVKYIVFI